MAGRLGRSSQASTCILALAVTNKRNQLQLQLQPRDDFSVPQNALYYSVSKLSFKLLDPTPSSHQEIKEHYSTYIHTYIHTFIHTYILFYCWRHNFRCPFRRVHPTELFLTPRSILHSLVSFLQASKPDLLQYGLNTRSSSGIPRARPQSIQIRPVASAKGQMGSHPFQFGHCLAVHLSASRCLGYRIRHAPAIEHARRTSSLASVGTV